MDWFTSDWHIDHANIIKYCFRPFDDVSQMNNAILNNVNTLVMPDDRLFNLGDVAFKSIDFAALKARINCKNVFVVAGNHDRERVLRRWFTVLPAEYMYQDEDYRIVLSHYRMDVWEHAHHGAGHLYGHSHGKLAPKVGPDGKGLACFDIGVDIWGYRPLNLSQVKHEMKRRTYTVLKGINYESQNYYGKDVKEHHGV